MNHPYIAAQIGALVYEQRLKETQVARLARSVQVNPKGVFWRLFPRSRPVVYRKTKPALEQTFGCQNCGTAY